jgi:dihydrofolate reductase
MRKITVFNYVSLDGYFAGANGEIDWFKSIKKDDEFEEDTHRQSGSGGTIIFGRTTYEMMKSYWPTPDAIQADPEMARVVNLSEKIVFSSKLKMAEDGANWKNVRLMNRIDTENINRLKSETGKDIVIIGSGSIVRQLTDLGLIDEFELMVVPVILGNGKSLFADVKSKELELVGMKAYKNGIVMLRYKPA